MKTDVEIAQAAQMKRISQVAAQLGLGEDDLEREQRHQMQHNAARRAAQ